MLHIMLLLTNHISYKGYTNMEGQQNDNEFVLPWYGYQNYNCFISYLDCISSRRCKCWQSIVSVE